MAFLLPVPLAFERCRSKRLPSGWCRSTVCPAVFIAYSRPFSICGCRSHSADGDSRPAQFRRWRSWLAEGMTFGGLLPKDVISSNADDQPNSSLLIPLRWLHLIPVIDIEIVRRARSDRSRRAVVNSSLPTFRHRTLRPLPGLSRVPPGHQIGRPLPHQAFTRGASTHHRAVRA